MKTDGVTVNDIAAFCGDLPSGPPPKGGPSLAILKSQKARSKLKQLHWKKLDSQRAKKSLWSNLDATTDSPQRHKLEEDMFAHFGKKKMKSKNNSNGNAKGGGAGSNLKPKGPQRILEGKVSFTLQCDLLSGLQSEYVSIRL